MDFYKLALYGLASAFVANEASANPPAIRRPQGGAVAPSSMPRPAQPGAGAMVRSAAPTSAPMLRHSSPVRSMPPSGGGTGSGQIARSATPPTQQVGNRASTIVANPNNRLAFGSQIHGGNNNNNQGGNNNNNDDFNADIRELRQDIRNLEQVKADRDEVYTRQETRDAIADAIADATFDIGIPDVSGKADKVVGAASGNIAGLNADGNLTDSGLRASEVLLQGDVGNLPGQLVMLNSNGRIDPSLYDASVGGLPDMPNDGNRYALMASSSGTAVWVRVRDEFRRD